MTSYALFDKSHEDRNIGHERDLIREEKERQKRQRKRERQKQQMEDRSLIRSKVTKLRKIIRENGKDSFAGRMAQGSIDLLKDLY